MTTETDTKPVEQTEEKKEEAKDEVKKEEAEVNNAEEKADDKAEKADKEKKDEKKEAKPKKDPAPPKPAVHKLDFEKDVVYLYQFTRTPVLPSLSPYCLKVETWLRLAGLKYEVSGLAFSLRRGSWGVPESRRRGGEQAGGAASLFESRPWNATPGPAGALSRVGGAVPGSQAPGDAGRSAVV